MQISREKSQANVVRAWEPGRIRIGEQWLHGHLIITAERVIADWAVESPSRIDVASLEPAIALAPEIILLGTGPELILPDVDLMAQLAAQRIGLEIMSTSAACRTFNLLVHEDRRVAAALLNPAAEPE
ncbi:MAG TPA: MTH938/NDUFAF3 family protein [Gammaproteobacteria bacterium]|nr:MTH938/NDUFAF3 family protein [Gammaproteobacteria bacterium]